MTIESYSRRSVYTALKEYCHHAKEHDFVELTRWHNEEGFDVTIDDKTYSFTDGQMECMVELWMYGSEEESRAFKAGYRAGLDRVADSIWSMKEKE